MSINVKKIKLTSCPLTSIVGEIERPDKLHMQVNAPKHTEVCLCLESLQTIDGHTAPTPTVQDTVIAIEAHFLLL